MNNVQILEMTLSDLELISNNLITDFDDFWNVNILKSELQNPLSKYIVAKSNSEILGFAGIIDTIDQVEITNIVVKKNMRNKGIGNLLLNELISIAKTMQKNSITLEVNCSNMYAIKLYEKNGFKTYGLRKKYYNNINDAKIMTLKLN